MKKNNNHRDDEIRPSVPVWPPTPLNLTDHETRVSRSHIMTKHAWLKTTLGMLLGVVFPTVLAIFCVFVDENVHSAPYSAIVLPVGYLASVLLSLITGWIVRRRYQLFGTAMLIGIAFSLFPFGLLIWALFNVPQPPS